ncbi:hypothetical protein PPYR_09479 [Photinus pyralis]|uniref:cGMP-dependent protein kinase n=1 Tax=Photinus pyralis TaxID=7054 RepID=A0A5N4AMF0_PHOPY|nr:cGMP-dependent protein kinase, isozyme 1-like [Photinus pyralis]KAB0798486.1 hypothetical protein PPYR_09479 [Photinus pyralis]
MFLCRWRKSRSWNVPQAPPAPTKVLQHNGDGIPNPVKARDEISNEVDKVPDSLTISDDDLNEVDANRRRSGLAGHSKNVDEDFSNVQITKYSKSEADEQLIKDALKKNEFLKNLLEGGRLEAVVDAMYDRTVKENEIIIKEGSVGTQLYISANGTYKVIIKNKLVSTFDDNRVFGELAILYDAKRLATIEALSDGRVWVLEQSVYQKLMLKSEIEHRDQLLNFLQNVPKLNSVPQEVLSRVTDLLKREFFAPGAVIVQQGDEGDKFYIISAGSVTISRENEGKVGNMVREEFFGELALLNDIVRQATVVADPPGVECFSLSREDFILHFGNVEDIENISYNTNKAKISNKVENPYIDIQLSDLERRSTLGVGGFGRVELVQHKAQEELVFALKYLKKIDMVLQHHQEHVFNEKLIQISCDSIFIVRMYKTMRDNKYLYFLMEACLGGDLWSLLQRQKGRRFEETTARFYAASVLEALAYLHERSIVYRDLKPENLLLDPMGNLKLTDFGFAKKLGPKGRSYTFAGTPEYVAPEIVLNRGHDRSVDYWALGIFIFEMIVGRTPFRSNDSSYMKTYNLILRGIESIMPFPEVIPRKAGHLIKKLCRSMPTERLGCQKEGVQAIRDHRWFTGFDWELLQAGQLRAPFKRSLKSNIDTQYFDKFQKDSDIPPDELSGWDDDFENLTLLL